ncbi:MAG: helix-turn-helix transcriptional regulator [Spirochaetes bacterium]|nr:helix-turn-helix transcriptional regulator [Spirochaetota bacterium]
MEKTIYNLEYKKIIKKLKLARVEAEMSQEEAGKHFGRDNTFISKIERYDRRLDIMELINMARLYKKPLSFFLKDID